MDYTTLLTSPTFFHFLLEIDIVIAEQTRLGGCFFCEGRLHTSNWVRAGFGIPDGCEKEVLIRHSFTCASCEKRCTPNSLRFMYYRWYTTAVELVVTALRPEGDSEAQKKLRIDLGISDPTLASFRKWWRDKFPESPFEKRSPLPISSNSKETAPSLILKHFEKQQNSAKELLRSITRFLSVFRTRRLWALFEIRTSNFGSRQLCPYSPFSMD